MERPRKVGHDSPLNKQNFCSPPGPPFNKNNGLHGLLATLATSIGDSREPGVAKKVDRQGQQTGLNQRIEDFESLPVRQSIKSITWELAFR